MRWIVRLVFAWFFHFGPEIAHSSVKSVQEAPFNCAEACAAAVEFCKDIHFGYLNNVSQCLNNYRNIVVSLCKLMEEMDFDNYMKTSFDASCFNDSSSGMKSARRKLNKNKEEWLISVCLCKVWNPPNFTKVRKTARSVDTIDTIDNKSIYTSSEDFTISVEDEKSPSFNISLSDRSHMDLGFNYTIEYFTSNYSPPVIEALTEDEDTKEKEYKKNHHFKNDGSSPSDNQGYNASLENRSSFPSFYGGKSSKLTKENVEDASNSVTVLYTASEPVPDDMSLNLSSARENGSDLYALFRSRYPVEEWKTLGFFTEDYLHLINPHWLQFDPPYHSSHYILAALYTLVMSVGVTGNCLVIFMFLRCRSLRTPANVLVMNLAISDFFLLAKMPVFIFNSFYFGPALGEIGCEIYGFLGGLTGTVSIMTLAAIALDRYYVIVYPLERRTTRQRARVWVILVWCYGSLFASLPLADRGFSRYIPEGYLTSCSFDYLDQSTSNRVFILVFFCAAWFIPFCIITFCYTKIYRVVISESSGASSRRGQEQEKRKTEIRLAGVVIGVVGLWFVAWTPYAIVALLGISGNAYLISPISSMIPALFCKTASCIDPFIYAVTHPRFRREFNKFFCRRKMRKKLDGLQYGRTQCWKTETSQIPGMVIGIKKNRTDDSYSEEDVEEMVVIVDDRLQKGTCFTSSTIAPQEHNLCEITFPLDPKTNRLLQHPSWFASPYFKRDRSTSLKLKPKKGNKSNQSEPISV